MAEMDLKTAAEHANAIVDHVRNRYAKELKPLERLAEVLNAATYAESAAAAAEKRQAEASADLKHLLGEIELASQALILSGTAERAAKERAAKAEADASEAEAGVATRIRAVEATVTTRTVELEKAYATKRVELEKTHAKEIEAVMAEIAELTKKKAVVQKEIDALLSRLKS